MCRVILVSYAVFNIYANIYDFSKKISESPTYFGKYYKET